ncbi:hypothetical protein TA3x_000198 [Tundrisphaera sp. TA3]|uniref:hypothetical protein n=1 Tax=Tundrisphaera sp. TA3 TaxID=3435775 RepID=UPI003EBB74B4
MNGRPAPGFERRAAQENQEMDRKSGGARLIPLADPSSSGRFLMPYGKYKGLSLAEIANGAPGREPDPRYVRWVANPKTRFRSADAVRAACGFLHG